MTPLVKPVRRVVRSKDGLLVVEMRPDGLNVRALYQRDRYPTLPWSWLLLQAAKLYEPKPKRARR